jgi:hypothetical protein
MKPMVLKAKSLTSCINLVVLATFVVQKFVVKEVSLC